MTLRPLQTVHADRAAAAAHLIHDGQARRAMFVEFPPRFFHGCIRAAASGRGTHDFFDGDFGGTAVISRHAATYIALGDDADQLEVSRILYHGRAAAA